MNDHSTLNGETELIDEFCRRFPLLDNIVGKFGRDISSERIPWFFGFLLAAAAKPGVGSCCIVLDKTTGTTAIAAILSGLMRLQGDFPVLIERYACTSLKHGQRVKVKPSDFVYEYEGLWKGHSNLFRLKILDEPAWRSFPISDVLRLEPTERVLPKGTGTSNLGTFERSPLDQLLDLSTGGNNSLIQNTILLHTPRAHLARIIVDTTLARVATGKFPNLSCFLPWGFIGHDGSLKSNDPFQIAGEPLIAATSVSQDLALACRAAGPGTKTVLVDGARRLAQDLQAFDEIADRQRLIVIASLDEGEDIQQFKHRGCPVWYMTAEEMLLGESSAGSRTRSSSVGATIRSADVRRRCSVRTIDCNNDALQEAAASLERVAEITSSLEEAYEVEQALAGLFRLLFECSECCFGLGESTITELRAVREELARQAKWLEPEVRLALRDGVQALESAITTGGGEQKADAMLRVLADGDGTWAVATRSYRTAEQLRDRLQDLGADVPVLPVSNFSRVDEFDGIILPAWPNDRKFTRLKNLSIAPDIRILTYPFESKWVVRHQERERVRSLSTRLAAAELSAMLGIETQLLGLPTSTPRDASYPSRNPISTDLAVFKLEERVARRHITGLPPVITGQDGRKAQLIQFVGGCYALLTEWADLPLLNELIHSGAPNDTKLRSASASQLTIGDFVLFRASGDKEFLRLIAEDRLGVREYERLRDLAERWKAPLRLLGDGPTEIQRRLAAANLERTTQTIAGWLGNPDRIGPQNHDDIEVIATLAGDTELLSIMELVCDAITRIRGAHLSAGTQLTHLIFGELRGRVSELGDQPTLLDLGYGQAWVVQVDAIERQRRTYATKQVNRLLWLADSAF